MQLHRIVVKAMIKDIKKDVSIVEKWVILGEVAKSW